MTVGGARTTEVGRDCNTVVQDKIPPLQNEILQCSTKYCHLLHSMQLYFCPEDGDIVGFRGAPVAIGQVHKYLLALISAESMRMLCTQPVAMKRAQVAGWALVHQEISL